MDIGEMLKKLDDLFRSRRTDEVEPFLIEQLGTAMQMNDTASVLTILNELVGFYRSVGRHSEAMAMSERSLLLMEGLGLDGIELGTALVNAATAARAGGALDESLAYYRRAEKIYLEQLPPDDMRLAGFFNNYGMLHREMGNGAEAEKCFRDALNITSMHSEAHTESANTHVNWAGLLLAELKPQEALVHADEAVRIFERFCPQNHHFDAALTMRGDIRLTLGNYTAAIEDLERALGICGADMRMHMGNYRLILRKLESAYCAADLPDALKGMSVAQRDFEENGLPMLKEKFPEIIGRLAVGLAGEGSDCFGWDDILSADHDFGAGFCIWVPDDLYDQYGDALRAAYSELPEVVHGFGRKSTGNGRTGVISMGDFLQKWTGSRDGSPDFSEIDSNRLATAVNGKVFFDPSGEFTRIREELKKGYPEEIRRAGLAQALMEAAQSGQYNYARMMRRGEFIGAKLALARFAERVISCLYLLENRYEPYYKWSHRGMEHHPLMLMIDALVILQDQSPLWSSLEADSPDPADPAIELTERIAAGLIRILKDQGLSDAEGNYLEPHAFAVIG